MQKSNVILYLINAAIFILLEVAALNMLHNNGPLQSTWLSKGSQAVMGTVWGGAQNVKHYFSLKKSNDSLALENHDLRLRIAQFEAMLEGTQEVQAPMAANAKGKAGNFVYTPATIVKISNNSRHNYIIIGKGSNDGITKGSGVITGKGAIGVIDAVSSNYSYARSFKNHEMSISARLGRYGAIGPLSWNGRTSAGAILKEIPHHVEFAQGDTVYTSGYSSIFPPDIPLGTAGEAKIVNGATYEIEVTLLEDFSALRYVTVVDNTGQNEIDSLEKR